MRCPICKTTFDNLEFRPFCSERCKSIDLGRWLREEYKVPTNEVPTESDFCDHFAAKDDTDDN